jgi:hypothetical protein
MESSLASRSATLAETLAVLELGTNSLKLHLAMGDPERLEAHRVEWDVGFEVFSSRRISDPTIEAVLSQIQVLLGEHGADPARGPVLGPPLR